jgi:hypothetical protein
LLVWHCTEWDPFLFPYDGVDQISSYSTIARRYGPQVEIDTDKNDGVNVVNNKRSPREICAICQDDGTISLAVFFPIVGLL